MSVTYVFFGRSLPERALVSVSNGDTPFKVSAFDGNPPGDLYINIFHSQILARFECESEIVCPRTLRNIVEDATRLMLDVAGFFHGYGYGVEITSAVQAGSKKHFIFGIDIPSVKGIPQDAGITIDNIFDLQSTQLGHYLRSALADVREANRSPRDTGFYCYRAIETLKAGQAERDGTLDSNRAWELFRTHYSIDKKDILDIKKFADADRHGDVHRSMGMTDEQRAFVFTTTWKIICAFVLKERTIKPNPA